MSAAPTTAPSPSAPRAEAPPKAPPIVIRRMDLPFDGLSRHWAKGDPYLTHMLNGLHFVFPEGERFFIRSVRHFRDEAPDELRERIDRFFGQEAQHQRTHLHAFRAIAASGFEVQSFLDAYRRRAYEEIEPRRSPKLRLATTAALEHVTASLGEAALEAIDTEGWDEDMRALFMWHAAEEIEHKSVAFDLLQHVDPSYGLRVRGFVMGGVVLLTFWGQGLQHMLAQEAPEDRAPSLAAARIMPARGWLKLAGRLLDYLRPSFHPDDHENYQLGIDYLTAVGRLDG